MKTRLCLMALLAALVLSGCGQTEPTAADPAPTPPPVTEPEIPAETAQEPEPPARPEATVLEMMVEGEMEEIPATLYAGEGYSLYIPAEGWTLETDRDNGVLAAWESEFNDEVELSVTAYPGCTVEEVRRLVRGAADDYQLLEDKQGNLGGNDADGNYLDLRLYPAADGFFVLASQYPAEAAEGFGARLSVIADTFAADTPAETTPTTLYSGDGYALRIPAEGWVREGPSRWYAAEDKSTALSVERWTGTAETPMTAQRCYKAIVERDGARDLGYDFVPLENDTFWGTCSGCVLQVWLIADGVDCWAVRGEYLADSSEVSRTQLADMANSFGAE